MAAQTVIINNNNNTALGDQETAFSDASSYNDDNLDSYHQEAEFEESDEIVIEEELPHEEDEYEEDEDYEYPWPVSSDDSWAQLSSEEAIQKIIEKLPTYSSAESDDGIPRIPNLDPASDDDAGSFIEHDDRNDNDDDADNHSDEQRIPASQLSEYDPHMYLASIELYHMYVVAHSDDDNDADVDDDNKLDVEVSADTQETPFPETPQPQTPNSPVFPDTQESQKEEPTQEATPIIDKAATATEAAAAGKEPIESSQTERPPPPPRSQIEQTEKEQQNIAPASTATGTTIVTAVIATGTSAENMNIEAPRKSSTSTLIEPRQSEIPVIDENAAAETEAKESVIEIDDTPQPYRGKDAPRLMSPTRVRIKKVPATRAPKKFKSGMKVRIGNNSAKELSTPYDGEVGIIRYVGMIDNEKMAGIVLQDEFVWGDCDGVYKQQRYFECGDNRGVFVPIANVKKFVDEDARKKSDEFIKRARQRRRVQRNNAQMYGQNVDNLWQHRVDLVRQKKYRIHKPGPREFGRIEYFGGDDEYVNVLNDNTHWLAPRLDAPRKRKGAPETVKPKAGPREIGRYDDFVGIDYDETKEAAKRAKKKQELERKKREEYEKAKLEKLKYRPSVATAETPLQNGKSRTHSAGSKTPQPSSSGFGSAQTSLQRPKTPQAQSRKQSGGKTRTASTEKTSKEKTGGVKKNNVGKKKNK